MTLRRNGSLVSTLLLVVANVLIPVSILTFATGFFPYKPLLPGLAQYDDFVEYGAPPAAPFDRLIFMVVDALRSDFVFAPGSGFEYTQSLIRDGAAVPFTANARSPTVTMPRLKAITTGSIPSFLDVVLNLDEGDESSSLASQDSWLAQMKAKETGKLVMYGDDTWLKLFPNTFDRAEGTTSFFVADFTEVDNNVTRHIADEMKNDDWSTMVLHYLGLDHIGHKGGPRSVNMLPKQREMDAIVKRIFHSMETEKHLQSTIFVICGDHGMNDAGNHGASSPGETSAALVFMSPKLKALGNRQEAPLPETEDFQYYTAVEQSDLAPTLGALLGFPAPKNNLGALIPDFLPFWSSKNDRVQILMRNAHQILDIVTQAFGSQLFNPNSNVDVCGRTDSDTEELACEWQRVSQTAKVMLQVEEIDHAWVSSMTNWLRRAQGLMSSMASNYHLPRMFLGQGLAAVAVACAIGSTRLSIHEPAAAFVPFGIVVVAYGIMMFASSYVEEEHHFWYWSTTAWLGYITLKGFNSGSTSRTIYVISAILALVATRLIRGWNQTGQKFAGNPDIVSIFVRSNPTLLWVLVSAAYLWIHRKLVQGFDGLPKVVNVVGSTALIIAAFTFKLAFTQEDAPELVVGVVRDMVDVTAGSSLVSRARAVFIGLAAATACLGYFIFTKRALSGKVTALTTLHSIYTLLAMTQSRSTNIPLFLLFNLQHQFLAAQVEDHGLSLPELATASLLLQYVSFFAAGGSNAISSVDISSAYNGVAEFDIVAVGVLTFISNWAGPVFWTSATVLLLVRKARTARDETGPVKGSGKEQAQLRAQTKGNGTEVYKGYVALMTVFATASVAAVMAACTILRTHLFIWTVFSPKYLYCMAWSLGQHLLVNVGFAGALFWIGME